MAAWGLFEKRNVETLSRVASARTLDGFKVRARLGLNFPRAMVNAEAEAVMMEYARAFAAAVERELSGGALPFEEPELLDIITKRVTALPKSRVRIAGLHVWHKGAVSSGSMPAVQPKGNNNPTVPAMRAVRVGATADSSAVASSSSGSSQSLPAQNSGRSKVQGSTYSSTNLRPTGQPLLRKTVTNLPAQRASSSSLPAAHSSAPPQASSQSFRAPPTEPTRRSVLNSQRVLVSQPSATDSQRGSMVSGMVPATEPKIRTASGFSRALSSSTEGVGSALGAELGEAVRDAAAGLLFASLEASYAAMQDPLKFLDATADDTTRQGLVSEGCVCVCYLLYEALTRTEVPQMRAIEMVQGACTKALGGGAVPVNDIGRYLASANPIDELIGRLSHLLALKETRELKQRLGGTLRVLRAEVRECALLIQSRMAENASRDASTG